MKTTKNITVREYALLVKEGELKGIDCSSIPSSAFEWLLANGHSNQEKQQDLIKVIRYRNTTALKVINFVGILETPCGTKIEILPKICNESNELVVAVAKHTLLKMLGTVFNLSLQQFHQSKLEVLKRPLFEILITQFLNELSQLIKRGVRKNYQRINEQSLYLKGKLELIRQSKQRPGQDNIFHISHEKYLLDCPENRLIRSSLEQVLKWTISGENKRLGKKLLFFLDEIPCSLCYEDDFIKWSNDRSLVHYKNIKPWCKLILNHQTPVSFSGNAKSVSFLFPMEKLFERYVAIKLRGVLPSQFCLQEQPSRYSLLYHKNRQMFRLQPDLIITYKKNIVCVADTKWKLLNEDAEWSDKYCLRQSDLYQMFAYGSKYLQGAGNLYLIYPKHTAFKQPLEPFKYTEELNLFVVPFDLETDSCPLVCNLPEKYL